MSVTAEDFVVLVHLLLRDHPEGQFVAKDLCRQLCGYQQISPNLRAAILEAVDPGPKLRLAGDLMPHDRAVALVS